MTSADSDRYGRRPRFATLTAMRPPGSSVRAHSANTSVSICEVVEVGAGDVPLPERLLVLLAREVRRRRDDERDRPVGDLGHVARVAAEDVVDRLVGRDLDVVGVGELGRREARVEVARVVALAPRDAEVRRRGRLPATRHNTSRPAPDHGSRPGRTLPHVVCTGAGWLPGECDKPDDKSGPSSLAFAARRGGRSSHECGDPRALVPRRPRTDPRRHRVGRRTRLRDTVTGSGTETVGRVSSWTEVWSGPTPTPISAVSHHRPRHRGGTGRAGRTTTSSAGIGERTVRGTPPPGGRRPRVVSGPCSISAARSRSSRGRGRGMARGSPVRSAPRAPPSRSTTSSRTAPRR